ncbi:hypothetical protein CFHF_00605 [Caulobacter flavus]|uniref:Uncharacterized protein n=1 Tax=Caulobacter flavus TaxID=1679497 RepID=A0A2N5D678_9CAUL|nr:hypothetical protein [Caulobacter flavus]AYV45971.1 hypothetical protein C1707_06740 [Caulobacter flavus]PLR21486.1 hypothetical protein CFHF_00605 [Caulobacter flavus]
MTLHAGGLAAALLLVAATPAAAETLLTRTVGCKIGDAELPGLLERLAAEDQGMKTAVQHLAAPSGALYRLDRPVDALGHVAREIYLSPGRIALVVAGQDLAAVSARLRLTPDPYGPAERRIDDTRKIVAYALHQAPLAGKVLVGCEYESPVAQAWLAPDDAGF